MNRTLLTVFFAMLVVPHTVMSADECLPGKKLSKVTDFPVNATGDAAKPNPGNLEMYLHVPDGVGKGAPLVVVLHGCTQSALTFDDQAEWRKLAGAYKFVLLMPQQIYGPDKNKNNLNNSLKCYNWNGYYGYNAGRGEGEAASIAQMIDRVKQSYAIDEKKVFVTGFSAGGSMAVRMCAQYPDVFSACSFFAAAPYMCGNPDKETGDVVRKKAFACLGVNDDGFFTPRSGPGCRSGAACASAEFMASTPKIEALIQNSGYDGKRWPRVMIWQGDHDELVDPRLADILRNQWLRVHEVSEKTAKPIVLNETSSKYSAISYGLSDSPAVIQITLKDMKHGIPVDPGHAARKGGSVNTDFWAGGYSHDWDVYGSYESLDFFGVTKSNQDCKR